MDLSLRYHYLKLFVIAALCTASHASIFLRNEMYHHYHGPTLRQDPGADGKYYTRANPPVRPNLRGQSARPEGNIEALNQIAPELKFTVDRFVFESGVQTDHVYIKWPGDSIAELLLFDTDKKMIYTTEDGLKSSLGWKTPVDPDFILPHPINESKLLLYSYTEQELYVSGDFAASWNLVSKEVLPGFHWGDKDVDQSEDVVHLEIEGETPSQATYKACIIPGCQPVHEHLGHVGPFIPGSLQVHKEYILLQKEDHTKSETYLMVSFQRGVFKRAQFPTDALTNNFQILDLDDGQIFVAVHHDNIVNLYLSDVTGQFFVLSLTNVYHNQRPDWFEIEFAQVRGLDRTFMANKIVEGESSPSDMHIQTYISYDKGGMWIPLVLNKFCTVISDCALLLEVQNMYEVDHMESLESVPGLILAHGLRGQSEEHDFMSVFVSKDGGASWTQAPFNTTGYLRILDQGSVLTVIANDPNSQIIYYSLDQGDSWNSQVIAPEGLHIIQVGESFDEKSLILGLFGIEGGMHEWTYFTLNMTTLFTRKCNDSDFEPWTPSAYNSDDSKDKCLLGRIVEYSRRKPSAICQLDTITSSLKMNSTKCLCSKEDYECDFGFESKEGTCQRAKWFDSSFIPADCDDGGHFSMSQGYRKIPSDVCIERDEVKAKYGRTDVACPSAAPASLSLTTDMKTIPLGKTVFFFLEQARGSKWNTTYTWNFGDKSESVEITNFQNGSRTEYVYSRSGTFNVTVQAKNDQGSSIAAITVKVQDRMTKLTIYSSWAAVVDQNVLIFALPSSRAQIIPSASDEIHYLWSFGDEDPDILPLLSWNASVTHSYKKPGTYTIQVEASNSVSSVAGEVPIRIFGSAVVLEIKFDAVPNHAVWTSPFVASLLTQNIRRQIAQDLGLSRDCLSATLVGQGIAHLYVFPSDNSKEPSTSEVKDKIIAEVKKGKLGFNLLGSSLGSRNMVKIVSAKEISVSEPHVQEKSSKGPNLKLAIIAAAVLFIVFVGIVILLVIYCRRRRNMNAGGQYRLFTTQDDSDTLLDDDVAPLNLGLGLDAARPVRDDTLLDSGGNWLVMETEATGQDVEIL